MGRRTVNVVSGMSPARPADRSPAYSTSTTADIRSPTSRACQPDLEPGLRKWPRAVHRAARAASYYYYSLKRPLRTGSSFSDAGGGAPPASADADWMDRKRLPRTTCVPNLLIGRIGHEGKSDFQMWSPPALPRRSRQRQVQMLAQRRAYFRPQKPPRAVRWCSRELRVCSRRSISPAPTGAANKGIETDTAGDGESQRWRRGVVASTAGMRAAEGRAPRHSPPVPPKRTCEVAPVDLAI